MSDALAPESTPDPLEEQLVAVLPRLRAHLGARRPAVRRGELDDVAQEVVARALRYRESFDPERPLWPWLRRTADRVLADQRRAAARRPSLSDELEPTAPAEERQLDSRDEVERLLAPLASRERAILLRFHEEGQSVRSIARELDLPEGTVKSHLSRARRRLSTATRILPVVLLAAAGAVLLIGRDGSRERPSAGTAPAPAQASTRSTGSMRAPQAPRLSLTIETTRPAGGRDVAGAPRAVTVLGSKEHLSWSLEER